MRQTHKAQDMQDRELYTRLTAPQHIVQNHFTQHQAVEGYFENCNVPEFMGCDRLLRINTLYGSIQMAYDPKKGQVFLFANIKTSIYDTVASKFQQQLNDCNRRRHLKNGNENVAYSAGNQKNNAVQIYKAENKPWTVGSINPFISPFGMGALRKTMPFVGVQEEQSRREALSIRNKFLSQQEGSTYKNQTEVFRFRAERVMLLQEQNTVNSLIYRKQSYAQKFLKQLNLTFDLQKKNIFDYYRQQRMLRQLEAENDEAVAASQNQED